MDNRCEEQYVRRVNALHKQLDDMLARNRQMRLRNRSLQERLDTVYQVIRNASDEEDTIVKEIS